MSLTRSTRDFLFKIDFLKYVEILVQQRLFILVFCASAVSASLAFTYIFSEKYVSATMIFYRPVESSMLRLKDTEAFGAPVPTPSFKIIGQTLKDIVASEAILRPVVEKLHLDRDEKAYYPVWYQRWYHTAKDTIKEYGGYAMMILKYGRIIEEDRTVKTIIGLRKYLEISATKESYIFVLQVKDKYPRRAAAIVDAAGETIVEWLKSQDQEPAEKMYHQLEAQILEKERELKTLRSDREKLLKSRNVISVQEEADKGVKMLYDLEQEAERLAALSEEKKKKIAQFDAGSRLKRRVLVNPGDMKRMQSEKLFEEIDLEGLTARLSSTRKSIVELKGKLQALNAAQSSIQALDLRIDSVTHDYQQLKDMNLESYERLTSVESEARVMHKATVPERPSQPIKIYHVGLTAGLSLLFSTGLVYMLAFFNVRVFFSSSGMRARSSPAGKEAGVVMETTAGRK